MLTWKKGLIQVVCKGRNNTPALYFRSKNQSKRNIESSAAKHYEMEVSGTTKKNIEKNKMQSIVLTTPRTPSFNQSPSAKLLTLGVVDKGALVVIAPLALSLCR